LIGVPVIWVTANEVVPYARYLLPLYPGIAALAALFCLNAGSGRYGLGLLVLFAGWSFFVEPSPWSWAVAAAAAAIPVAALLEKRAGLMRAVPLARVCLLAMVTAASFVSPRAWEMLQRSNRFYQPEIAVLARQVPAFVPEGEKLVVGGGRLKLHNVIFYGRRPTESLTYWITQTYKPGEKRIGLFPLGHPEFGELFRAMAVASEGEWALLEMNLDPAGAAALADKLAPQ
jgi:hypothetical protein